MLSPRAAVRTHVPAASAGSSSARPRSVDPGGVGEWELGLPSASELMPISRRLIPPPLAAAFGIDRAVVLPDHCFTEDLFTSHLCFDGYDRVEGEGETEDVVTGGEGTRCGRKARMVWTPDLHHRFIEAVTHLGEKGAVPKAIVRLMNVDGLTRENVASHLQKYRLYLKRTRDGDGDRTGAATTPPQASPYFSRFDAQPLPDAGNRNCYDAFLSYGKIRCD